MTAKILVIDDEPQIRKLLNKVLGEAGYAVYMAETGAAGEIKATEDRPDLIILDLGLPDKPGLEVLATIRDSSRVPIIVLSANDHQTDKVMLLDAGADDYLTKPFGIPELLARIKVAFRHGYTFQSESAVFRYKTLEINFLTRGVTVASEPVKLTATEYDVLKLLAKYPGRIITQQQLLKEIWGKHSLEFTHYLRIYVAQLRKKLECFAELKGLIVTEAGIGYRLKIE
jgi:two-component system KDP operon response regulator KdpE